MKQYYTIAIFLASCTNKNNLHNLEQRVTLLEKNVHLLEQQQHEEYAIRENLNHLKTYLAQEPTLHTRYQDLKSWAQRALNDASATINGTGEQ